ncbi:IS1634 family transposase, partial [bacterium]|nr:IS1634 family transposase [bacterium]
CTNEEIEAIKLALKHKADIKRLADVAGQVKTRQGLAVGAVWVLHQLCHRIGLIKALGHRREAKLVLWMVLARVIGQGSRLSAARMAQRHAVCDIFQLDSFNEDDLYKAMDWLNDRQHRIESSLFKGHYGDSRPQFYLYDVTSSYLEGVKNELGDWGYNRDGKKGKKQIVIGLMTDEEGWPIAIEVFRGNTQDTETVKNQILKMAQRFGAEKVTFVGDRGMIKSVQIAELSNERFHYISAITKPQIEKLIKDGIFQMSLFDEKIAEVADDGIRYILRRNPIRAEEIEAIRESKLNSLDRLIRQQNKYLSGHPRAQVEAALKKVCGKCKSFKIDKWVELTS